jgi:hypothetical protein
MQAVNSTLLSCHRWCSNDVQVWLYVIAPLTKENRAVSSDCAAKKNSSPAIAAGTSRTSLAATALQRPLVGYWFTTWVSTVEVLAAKLASPE